MSATAMLAAVEAEAATRTQSMNIAISTQANTAQGATMQPLQAVIATSHGHTLQFSDDGEVDVSGTVGLTELQVANLYNAVATAAADSVGHVGILTAIEGNDQPLVDQLAYDAGIFMPSVDVDIRSVIKDMYYNGLEGMIEIPLEMNAWWDDLAGLNDQAVQQAMDQMVAGWWKSGKQDLPNYVEYTEYINGSDGWVIRQITIRVYDVDGSDKSGDVYRDGVKIDDHDANNDGYYDGSLAQWFANLFSSKRKKSSSSNGGADDDDDDTDGLIVFIPPLVNYMRVDTAPYYGPAMLSQQVISDLAANGGLDALRNHVAAQQQLGMSPNPLVLQQLIDAHFVPSTFIEGQLNLQALSLSVVTAP